MMVIIVVVIIIQIVIKLDGVLNGQVWLYSVSKINASPTWDPSLLIFRFLIQLEPFDSEEHCPSHPTPNKHKLIRRNVQEIVYSEQETTLT